MTSIIKANLLAISFFLVFAGSLQAVPRTWDGGAKNGSFTDPLNWENDASIPATINDTLFVGANTFVIGPNQLIGFDTGGEFRTPSLTFLNTATLQYTVTTGGGSDSLTLTTPGTAGTALLNSSPVRQKFDLITTTVGPATQTWDGGAQGLIMAQIDLGNGHVLTFDGSGATPATRNEISGGITGTLSGITKTGPGTLLLNTSVTNDYTGVTTLLTGRLQLGRANQIPNSSKLVLIGGTFDTGGFSDTIGVLALGGTATIDFGISDLVSLIFADSRSEPWSTGALNIINFAPGADLLRVGVDKNALTPTQLNQININGLPVTISNTGFLTPVPEPGVPAMLLSGAGLFAFCRRRRAAP